MCVRVASAVYIEELYLCIKHVENNLRTGFGLFADLGRFPEAVILPSQSVGGVWLRDYLLCFAKNGNMYVANSSILQYCHGMSIEGVLVFYRTTEYANSWEGGGLTVRRKRKSLLLCPPLFFLEVGRKKGGRNSGAVRYDHYLILRKLDNNVCVTMCRGYIIMKSKCRKSWGEH